MSGITFTGGPDIYGGVSQLCPGFIQNGPGNGGRGGLQGKILRHGGAGNGCNPRGIEEVADTPNVCVDTSGGDPEAGVVELAVERLGADRVVFGSDAPIRHFGVCLAKVLGAQLPSVVKRQILWDNLQARLPPWGRTEGSP